MQQLVPLIRRALALPDLPELAGESAAPCDIFAAEKQYELLLDAPGADPQDVNLELLEDHLSISITRPQADEARRDRQVIRQGRASGVLQRLFVLPEDVDLEKVSASLDKGVLKVVLPRTSKARRVQAKSIPVRARL